LRFELNLGVLELPSKVQELKTHLFTEVNKRVFSFHLKTFRYS